MERVRLVRGWGSARGLCPGMCVCVHVYMPVYSCRSGCVWMCRCIATQLRTYLCLHVYDMYVHAYIRTDR